MWLRPENGWGQGRIGGKATFLLDHIFSRNTLSENWRNSKGSKSTCNVAYVKIKNITLIRFRQKQYGSNFQKEYIQFQLWPCLVSVHKTNIFWNLTPTSWGGCEHKGTSAYWNHFLCWRMMAWPLFPHSTSRILKKSRWGTEQFRFYSFQIYKFVKAFCQITFQSKTVAFFSVKNATSKLDLKMEDEWNLDVYIYDYSPTTFSPPKIYSLSLGASSDCWMTLLI